MTAPGVTGRALVALLLTAAPAAGAEGALALRLRAAGLERVGTPAPGLLAGTLPGRGGLRVALIAGCGAGAAAGREAALAAAGDLARTPRAHGLELTLCAGAGTTRAAAAAAWLAARPAGGEGLLAVLLLEPGEGGPALRMLPAAGAGSGRLPPAWLAHAALRGAGAAGAELAVGEGGWPLLSQLAGRYGRPRAASGAPLLLAAGLPALAFGGDGGEEGWAPILAAVVRRLDALAGRPRPDDVYLGLAGRIWSRRALYWIGLVVWTTLVLRGLPGAWRGSGSRERRRRGRSYLPGFALRMLLLAALLLAPVAALVLLAPAALLTLVPARRPAAVTALRAAALLPALALTGYLATAAVAGRAAAAPSRPAELSLVLAGLALALPRIGRRGGPAPPAS